MTGIGQFDVVVLGSGFGGSLLSLILTREGMSVALVDRARHPRFTIGESSTPAADLVLRDLVRRHALHEIEPLTTFGTWRDTYPQLNCGCKRGFSYFWHGTSDGFRATGDHENELFVTANASRTLADTQWYRPDVDSFFLRTARDHGVTVLEAADVTHIEHLRPQTWTLKMRQDGHDDHLRTGFVVDATGPAGLLMRRLPLSNITSSLHTRSYAVYSHWKAVRPLQDWLHTRGVHLHDHPFPAQDAAVHHLFDDGWLWQLRFEDDVTSLGFVFVHDGSGPAPGKVEREWLALWDRRPALRDVLGTPRLAPFPGRMYGTGRMQRLWSAGAGDDWAALPFTVGFIDALHSAGIAHTLLGVERLSRALLAPSTSHRFRLLQDYSQDVVAELQHIDRLISGCYLGLCDFRLFTAWTMVYFAGATTFERQWLQDIDKRPGFLCTDDPQFARLVGNLHESATSLSADGAASDREIESFCLQVREAIRPFNQVGLFEPQVPNMYHHTAAPK